MKLKQKLLLRILRAYVAPSRNERRARQAFLWTAGGAAALLAGRALSRRLNEYDLRGKTVLLTGGSRGLGLVLARELVREGARVAICARSADELIRAASELRERGGEVIAVGCDLTDPAQVAAMVETVHKQLGSVDVLINNAGVISVGPYETMTVVDFEEALQTNFWAALHTTLAVLPEMRSRQAGRIVNISSIGGKMSVPHLLPYSASKFALTGLSQGLHAELKEDGIIVTTVIPGLMRTGSPRNASFKGKHRAEYAWFSLGDALPFTSVSAEHAARRILRACRRGEAEVIVSWQAKLAAKFQGLFPGVTAELLGQINRLLPAPGGIGRRSAPGSDSGSALSPSWLTSLSDAAAERNNQIH